MVVLPPSPSQQISAKSIAVAHEFADAGVHPLAPAGGVGGLILVLLHFASMDSATDQPKPLDRLAFLIGAASGVVALTAAGVELLGDSPERGAGVDRAEAEDAAEFVAFAAQ